jgi:hypothetical protein
MAALRRGCVQPERPQAVSEPKEEKEQRMRSMSGKSDAERGEEMLPKG